MACVTTRNDDRAAAREETSVTDETNNPLLQKWTGPYGGVPPLDKVTVADFQPALDAAMDLYRKDIQAIAGHPEPPTFENTFAELERARRTFGDVETLYGIWSTVLSDAQFQALEREMAPKLAAFEDEITQNEKLFQRMEA